MKITIENVVGYNTPNKKVLVVDDKPMVVVNGNARALVLIGYIIGRVTVDYINDGKVLGVLNKLREKYAQEAI